MAVMKWSTFRLIRTTGAGDVAFLDIGDGALAVLAALHKVRELAAVGGRSEEIRLRPVPHRGSTSSGQPTFEPKISDSPGGYLEGSDFPARIPLELE